MTTFSSTWYSSIFGKGASQTVVAPISTMPVESMSFGRTTVITALILISGVLLSTVFTYTDELKEVQSKEIETVKRDRQVLEQENVNLKRKIALYEGSKEELGKLSRHECEHHESILKATLHSIEQRKCDLLKNEIESEKGTKLCVICQEKEKSILLLPCRHLCLCVTCSSGISSLVNCPLCRHRVVERISVFA